jgi:hypothetical protein
MILEAVRFIDARIRTDGHDLSLTVGSNREVHRAGGGPSWRKERT